MSTVHFQTAFAVDGSRKNGRTDKSCSHTNQERNPWWMVDLGRSYDVSYLKVTNRGDCCGDRLFDFDVFLNNLSFDAAKKNRGNKLCMYHKNQVRQGATETLRCKKPTKARYVKIQVRGIRMLTLCEVEVYDLKVIMPKKFVNAALSKRTYESSTMSDTIHFQAAFAVDGSRKNGRTDKSCSHTKQETNPWWMVDLVGTYRVSYLKVTNRGDCCGDRLYDFDVLLNNLSFDAAKKNRGNKLCMYHKKQVRQGATETLRCKKPTKAKYVKIQVRGIRMLTLCEVEVYAQKGLPKKLANLALRKRTYESSTADTVHFQTAFAVDGSRKNGRTDKSCSHTNQETNPWWMVDLGRSYDVFYLKVTNRGDCCGDRLFDFDVFLNNLSFDAAKKNRGNKLCMYHKNQVRQGATETLRCKKPTTARYVKIQVRGIRMLTLCEVEVYGLKVNTMPKKLVNAALRKRTYESSTMSDTIHFQVAFAVDGSRKNGRTDKSCSHTKQETNPWWMVDLGGTYRVSYLKVTNRGDCCGDRLYDFDVLLNNLSFDAAKKNRGNKLCMYHKNQVRQGATETLRCKKPTKAKYVKIQVRGIRMLTLCEVEVYAQKVITVPNNLVNVALRKRTYESSSWSDTIHFQTAFAVDGNRKNRINDKSCTHTKREANPWWMVDLGGSHRISYLKVTNRGDCCADRLRNFDVLLNDLNFEAAKKNKGMKLCTYQRQALGLGETKTMRCKKPIKARFVKFRIRGTGVLTLCEVEVFTRKAKRAHQEYTYVNFASGRPAYQSSTYASYVTAAKAVDGNKNPNFAAKHCSTTRNDRNAWWLVDLGQTRFISHLQITNRGDCCAGRLRDFNILLGVTTLNDAKRNRYMRRCAFYRGAVPKGATITVSCDALSEARFVKIQLSRRQYLTLCEVEVLGLQNQLLEDSFSNVALNTKAKGGLLPKLAVDDNLWSCTKATGRQTRWWTVDLGKEYFISNIKITNPGKNGLKNFDVMTSHDSSLHNGGMDKCNYFAGKVTRGKTKTIRCTSITMARYVKISSRDNTTMALCDVKVIAYPDHYVQYKFKNVALRKRTYESTSSTDRVNFRSSNAVDGSRANNMNQRSCTHTKRQANPWWMVDLGGQYYVSFLKVTNRGDCCGGRLRHFDVLLNNLSFDAAKKNRGNKLCMFHRNAVRQRITKTLRCKKLIKARYVKIQIRGRGIVTLCEVEVYAAKDLTSNIN